MFRKVLLAALAAGVAASAQAKTDGLRVAARLGYETPTVSGSGSVYKIGSAVSYGAEIGYDAKIGGGLRLGPYATYDASSVTLCDGSDCLKVDHNLGLGARLGYELGNGVLYAKAGYSEFKLKASSGAFTADDDETGVQGAIGYEANFGRNLFWLIEFDYADFGSFAGVSGINLQRRHVATGLGVRF